MMEATPIYEQVVEALGYRPRLETVRFRLSTSGGREMMIMQGNTFFYFPHATTELSYISTLESNHGIINL